MSLSSLSESAPASPRLCPPEAKCVHPRLRVAEGPCWRGEELRRLGLDFNAEKTDLGREGVQPQLRASTSSLGLDPENVGGEPRRGYS